MKTNHSKTQIINAAITVIEKEGFHRFSIDKVAVLLDCDAEEILSVFPDSNVLISAALEESIINGFEKNLDECIQNYRDNTTFLQQLFKITLSGAHSYPKLIRSHFYSSFMLENSHSTTTLRLKQFIEKTWEVIESNVKVEKKLIVRRKLNQAVSSLLFAALFPVAFEPIDFNAWATDLANFVVSE